MKRFLTVIIFILSILSCYATEYSEYAAKQYEEKCNVKNAKITVKKEHIEEYAQEIGNTFVPYIAYGYGDLKCKKCRKQRISYVCLLDCKLNPLWSHIIPR